MAILGAAALVPDQELLCEFLVVGKPEPQGSAKAMVPVHPKTKQPYRRAGGGIVVNVVSDNPALKAWRERVAIAARGVWDREPVDAPVRVDVAFMMRRPDSHMGTGRNAGTVKASAPPFPTVRPDVDKLIRGLLDALTDLVWADDARVIEITARKLYAPAGESDGAWVRVWQIDTDDPGDMTLAI